MVETETGWTVESAMGELRSLFPDHARRVQVTETLLTANSTTIVVGGQSATYQTGTAQQNLNDCMVMARRWHARVVTIGKQEIHKSGSQAKKEGNHAD